MKTFTNNKTRHSKGLIFNIQKFSLNDGPGIRTVIFFKGCPLRCPWCANPESQRACPEKMYDHVNGNTTVVGEFKSIAEIIKMILQDRDYYEESNGGVTFSGGEVLNQAPFAIELAKVIKNEGIHLVCETTGFSKPAVFQEFMKYMDLIFYDVKHWDSEKHRAITGVDNEIIIHNLESALTTQKKLIVRIPIIPCFNDTLSDAAHFSQLFKRIGVTKVELLPFHQFGLNKYAELGRKYEMKDVRQLHAKDLQDYKKVLNEAGITVKLNGAF
ncbi:glycyl-radical enzyme activating protein [Sporolactobacillus shoreicorticis]|uniref:Glycyl-radical enzyme activating protein n=1 Tax=Sporolactobacillus shoreicorticis TaxID=1923877 RepID=A0ABW5RYB5_9BACL|nr:glycyl-radical enzyme activating protein [Sporolactobacillus shoreicorticis]MCO7124793.1 glycyl-radical enzyme activating protein [Sporolactobacillus shoreicorticis]